MFIGIVLAVLVAEVALRLAGIEVPQFYAYDADRGVRHRAGAQGLYRGDGESTVRINSAGLRSPELSLAKPPNTLRIAILGDSMAEAFGVSEAETFWAVMGRDLRSCPALQGRLLEVINFGVSGYGTSTEWISLQREGWTYDPDVVLLAFFSGNDLRNNVPELERKRYQLYHELRGGRLVEFRPAGAWEAAVHRVGARSWRALAEISRVAQVLNMARRWAVERWRQSSSLAAADPLVDGREEGIDAAVLAAPPSALWEHAWEITTAVIEGLAEDVRGHGRQLQIAAVSNAIQVHPEARVRQDFMQRLGLEDLGYAERRIGALAQRLGVPYIELAPPLLQWAEQHQRCVHGFAVATPCFGHWNVDGHRVAGELLARRLCAALPRP